MKINKYFEERKKCPLCNSKKIKLIFDKEFNSIGTNIFFSKHLNKKFPMKILEKKRYILSECRTCKMIFQNNILNKKFNSKFYDEYIDHKSIRLKKNKYRIENNLYKKEIIQISKIYQDKKIDILEFGAGMGSWVTAMKNSGFKNIFAIEISKQRRKILKKNKIKCFSKLEKINRKFDFIYSDQTFEHLTEPGKTIKKLIKLLKKNGYILFKIPPGRFLKSKLNNKYKAQKDEAIPLEHINIFTNDTIRFIAKKYNLKKVNFSKFFNFY